MLHYRFIFGLLLASLLIHSCTNGNVQQKISTEKLKEIVEKQNELLGNYFKSGDAEKVASLYTDSAKLSPDGNDFVLGRDSIKAFWKNDFKSSKLIEMKTEVLTTSGTEEVIYETGKTTTKSLYKDSVYTFTVKYVNVWLKQADGTYKLDIDFWNNDK